MGVINVSGELTIVLEVKCDRCEGSGRVRAEGRWCYCGECNGAGYVPTDLGEKVLALMRHNFRPMLRDIETEDIP